MAKNLPAVQETQVQPQSQEHLLECSWRRKWQPTPVFLPGEFHRQKSLESYSPWGHIESDMIEQLIHNTHTHIFKSHYSTDHIVWKRSRPEKKQPGREEGHLEEWNITKARGRQGSQEGLILLGIKHDKNWKIFVEFSFLVIPVIRGVLGEGASLCCVGQQGKCKEVKTESVKSSKKKKTNKTWL